MNRILLLLLIFPSLTFSQRNWDAVEVKVHNVSENIAYLEGSGGNIGVIYGEEGIMMIDNQFAPLTSKINTAIATLSQEQLRYVINTHYHGDHTGGNENFAEVGATIVSHDNVRTRLGITFQNEALGREMEAKPETFWPGVTFSKDLTFHFNEEEIQITHFPRAHTDGDAIVFFKTSNVIHAGDCFVRYGYPYIDISAGGTIDGIIAAQRNLIDMANEETKIIPGHGEVSSIREVQELLQMLIETREIVALAKDQGESLASLLDREPLANYHERWSGSFIDSDLFVKLIYESL